MDDLFLIFNAGGDCEFHVPEVNGINEMVADCRHRGGEGCRLRVHDQDNPVMVYAQSVAVFAPEGQTEPLKDATKAGRRWWFQFGRRSK